MGGNFRDTANQNGRRSPRLSSSSNITAASGGTNSASSVDISGLPIPRTITPQSSIGRYSNHSSFSTAVPSRGRSPLPWFGKKKRVRRSSLNSAGKSTPQNLTVVCDAPVPVISSKRTSLAESEEQNSF